MTWNKTLQPLLERLAGLTLRALYIQQINETETLWCVD